MRANHLNRATVGLLAGLFLLAAVWLGFEQQTLKPVSADDFLRAMESHQNSLVDRYFKQHQNPNVRTANDRSLLFTAILREDSVVARRLLDAGANADLSDNAAVTPLMVASMHGDLELVRALAGHVTDIAARDRAGHSALYYAVTAQNPDVVDLLLNLTPNLELAYCDTGDLLTLALGSSNTKIAQEILTRLPQLQEWSPGALRALDNCLRAGDRESVRLLLAKHVPQPTPEGKRVPLLAYAIATDNAPLFATLVECGADANTTLPAKYDKEFLDSLPSKSFRNYIEDDRNVTCLMLAAGLGRTDYVRVLLQAGADRNRATGRYKMIALYFAAELGHWQPAQILLGSGPDPNLARFAAHGADQRWRAGFEFNLFDRSRRLLDQARLFRDHGQGAQSSFDHLSRRYALLHAIELSRFWNARRSSAELSGVARMHSFARGNRAKTLCRDPNRHRCRRSVRQNR